MMKRKKQSICAEVTWAERGIWFGNLLKEGHIASSIT